MRYLLLLFLMSCASYHPRGQLTRRLDASHFFMRIESVQVKEGDVYVLTRSVCVFFRGLYQCQQRTLGRAKVEKIYPDGLAEVSAPADAQPLDYLLPF